MHIRQASLSSSSSSCPTPSSVYNIYIGVFVLRGNRKKCQDKGDVAYPPALAFSHLFPSPPFILSAPSVILCPSFSFYPVIYIVKCVRSSSEPPLCKQSRQDEMNRKEQKRRRIQMGGISNSAKVKWDVSRKSLKLIPAMKLKDFQHHRNKKQNIQVGKVIREFALNEI